MTSSVSNLGNLSISGSSITSSDATGIDFADTILRTTGTINSGELNASDINASGNITINGNLNVKGTTTTINTTNVEVSDPLMILSSGTEGIPSVDSGFIIERGTSQNVGLIWDESLDVFSFVNTDNTGDTTTNVTIDSYADVRVKNLILDNGTVSTTINADDLSKLNGVTDGTLAANKAIITDNNQHVDKLKQLHFISGESGTATKVNSSADEINLLNTASAGTVVDGKAVVYSASGQVIATTLKSTGIAEVASGSKIGTMTITDDTISTTHAGNKIKFGANNLVTTGTINAADITLSGTVSSTGIMTGASGSQFGDVKIEDGKITTSATNNTLSFELNNISTSGTLSSGDATLGDVTSGSITATGTGSFSSTITAAVVQNLVI